MRFWVVVHHDAGRRDRGTSGDQVPESRRTMADGHGGRSEISVSTEDRALTAHYVANLEDGGSRSGDAGPGVCQRVFGGATE